MLRKKLTRRGGFKSGIIDRKYRFELPSELDVRVGQRLFYSLCASGPPGLVISKKPVRLFQNRIISSRVQRLTRPQAKRG